MNTQASLVKTNKAELVFTGPWHILTKVKNVLCPDGKRRVARISSIGNSSNTYSIKFKGKTVTGWVCGLDGEDYEFRPYLNLKNGKLFFNNYMVKVD